MPTVRLLSGLKYGEQLEVAPDVAHAWVTSGKAELVTHEPVETPERAARQGIETRRRPGRPRKSAE